jgi:hypothetical protein
MNSRPGNFSPYEKLLVGLVRAGVDFAVVGGVAISMNGFIRATEDVGVIVSSAPENLIFLKEGSWREKDRLEVSAMREIPAREGR